MNSADNDGQESANADLFTGRKKPGRKKAARLKRFKTNVSFPGEAMPAIHALRRKWKMTLPQFINTLVAYGCWAERDPHLTGPPVLDGGASEQAMWEEIIKDAGKEKKTGSFFAHRVEEVIKQRFGEPT